MLLSNTATVIWNAKNKKHYVDLGYVFTNMGDKFNVNVEHLTKGSSAIVKIKCDYCGKEYDVVWECYLRMQRKTISEMDACADCIQRKVSDSIVSKYGSHSNKFYASNTKRKETNLIKYGCDNPFESDLIKEKIKNTNIKKYGVPYTMQNPDIVKKGQQTCLEKYGVINYGKIYSETHIKEYSPTWKGGVDYTRNERSSFEYRAWRKKIFDRDLYTCKKCGAKSKYGSGSVELNAHHIFNWRDNECLRYNIDNGITLCNNCHNEFHIRYGKRFNNEDQLNEYLKEKIDEKIC